MKPTKKPPRRPSFRHKPPSIPVYTIGKTKRWKREYVQLYDRGSDAKLTPVQERPYLFSSVENSNLPCMGAPGVADCSSTVPSEPKRVAGDHLSRISQLAKSWQDIQAELRTAHYTSHAPATHICCMCDARVDDIILCYDCGPTSYYCHTCSQKIHQNAVLHVPRQWKGKFYVDLDHGKKFSMPWHECGTTTENWIKVIDCLGRAHDVQVPFCGCHSKAVTLLQLNLWPGSPVNPQMAFDLRLMTLSRSFLLEAHTSLQAFCASLQHAARQFQVTGSKVNLYRVLVSECAAQFRRFSYDTQHLHDVSETYPDGMQCPLCVATEHELPRVISVDGNFRLVRKKAAGSSPLPGYHDGRMFLPDITSSTSENMAISEDIQECSDFKAGDISRSKQKSQKLDVMGLFGAICIHDYPRHFIDMTSGESLKYAVAILNEISPSASIKFLYDIGCKLHSHLKARNHPLLEKTAFAVPLFHGYAHNSQCQMSYNPRRQKDLRMADGENMERLWSVLDHFAYMTREMAPSNRKDLIVEVLIHIGESGVADIGRYLTRRYTNAEKIHTEASSTLDSAITQLAGCGYPANKAVVRQWKAQEESFFLQRKGRGKTTVSWKEDYAILLKKWYNARIGTFDVPLTPQENSVRMEIQSLDEKLKKLEKRYKVSRWAVDSHELDSHLQTSRAGRRKEVLLKLHREASERCHLLVVKKHARGYDAVTRVTGLIKKVNGTITRLVKDYNCLADLDSTTPITFDDSKNSTAMIYESMTPVCSVPYHLHRSAVDAVCLMDRATEEMHALRLELHGMLRYYSDLKGSLQFSLAKCPDSNLGLYSLLFQHAISVEYRQLDLKSVACRVFDENVHVDTPFLSQIDVALVTPPNREDPESEQIFGPGVSSLDIDGDNDLPTDDEL